MHLLVDPIVLCLPENTATSEEIGAFVKHLIIWNEVVRDRLEDDQFCITQKCFDALIQANRYPYQEFMMPLIDGRQDDLPYDGNTAYMACRQIIEGGCWPSFEEIVDLPVGEFDSSTVNLDPDLLERIPPEPPEIKESFRESFGYIAYARGIQQNTIASNLLLLTHPIDENRIAIDIELTVIADDNLNEVKVETDLPIAETPQDMLRHRNLTDIWEDTRQAIDWAVIHHEENEQISPYAVAPGFNDSLGDCQFPMHSSRLDRCFEKIAQLLAGKSMSDDYELRTGEGPGDPQLEQKVGTITWKARRLRITSGSGAVYRLHYWTAGNEYIFSNVVSKNDSITIYEIDEEIVKQIK